MIKITQYISLALLIIAGVILTGCTGAAGNPTELTGIWEYIYETSTTEGTITADFKDTGSYTLKEEITIKATSTTTVTEYAGTIMGDPSANPKTVYFNQKSITSGGTATTDTRTYSAYYEIHTINSNTILVLTCDSNVHYRGKYIKKS